MKLDGINKICLWFIRWFLLFFLLLFLIYWYISSKKGIFEQETCLKNSYFPSEPNPTTPSHPQGLISLETIVSKVTGK